jgi:hypothetical protein
MWADVVFQIERLHLLRLLFWAAMSTVAGTGLLVLLLTLRRGSTMIHRFAAVCALFGAAELVFGVIGYRQLPMRDLASATRLERLAWLQLGLYIGIAGIGVTMCVVGRSVTSRAGAAPETALPSVGAGIAVALHGLALATLELLLLAALPT